MSEPARVLMPVPAEGPASEPTKPASEQADGPKTFRDVLASLVGKVVTVVNPESYEAAPVGTHITHGIYRAKVMAVTDELVTLATEFVHRRGEKEREPVRQFVPLSGIKRVSLMRSERVLHI